MGAGRKGIGVEIKDGTLRVSFTWQGRRCREPLKLKPTPPNMRYAERLVTEVKEKIRLGVFDYAAYFPNSPRAVKAEPTRPPTFSAVAERWLAWKRGEVAYSTLIPYEGHLRFWCAQLGDRLITEIKQSDILVALGCKTWRSAKTRNNNLIALRGVFDLAVGDGDIAVSPAARLKNLKWQREEPDPFDAEEEALILCKLADRYPPSLHDYFDFMFATGMRPSESIALLWPDIDWRKAKARIAKARVRGRDKDTTKTYVIRHVDLTDRALAALQRQKEVSFFRNDQVIWIEPGFDRPWEDERRQREFYWNPTLKALGIRSRSPYQTRHTFATRGLMNNVNPAYIARQLGHKNAQMLFKVYAKWIDDGDGGSEREKMNAAICGRASAK